MTGLTKTLARAGRAAACAFALSALMGGAATAVQAASIDIQVTPWLAPNIYGSPSFGGAAANQFQALYTGASSFGTPGTPTYYEARSDVTSAEVIVTGFPSWLGQANPGSMFGPAFAGELGNRMHFGLLAVGDGMQFSIDQLSFSATSTDPYNALGISFPNGYTYSAQWVGILFGLDGAMGGGDDTFITAGPASQLVDAIIGRGSGSSFAAYCVGCTVEEQQAKIAEAAAYPGSAFQFIGTYSIGQYSGSGTFNIAVPEPASLTLMAGGLLGLGLLGRRARRKVAGR